MQMALKGRSAREGLEVRVGAFVWDFERGEAVRLVPDVSGHQPRERWYGNGNGTGSGNGGKRGRVVR